MNAHSGPADSSQGERTLSQRPSLPRPSPGYFILMTESQCAEPEPGEVGVVKARDQHLTPAASHQEEVLGVLGV